MRSSLALGLLALVIAGCATETYEPRPPPSVLPLPMGHSAVARAFACPYSIAECYERAAQVCPEGFDVQAASAPLDASLARGGHLSYGGLHLRAQGSLVVACAHDRPESIAACDRAWSLHAEVAKFWSERRENDAHRARRPVPEETFFAACEMIPLPAERCLDRAWREAHPRGCERALDELEKVDVAMLDVALLTKAKP